ncbi:hypothetical protein [Paenibacillus sacheonensis]|uniref:NAD(P)-binding domain-containing protein n=1 Tax=Paenibacillus sacheonensis TaxID=742054 RepID=A0A7X4YLY7_9BACL|nr:hypothetical protein [Paenibacillus sacheonensis]MBM7565869.1 nucleoside-diphosphate-sugar epimerase [Paenibacillus sacheonensis]NBC68813.1 hypothetical protein [Paenibacillus sacheonensis]
MLIEAYHLELPARLETMDLSRERAELGYEPRYNFGTFIQEFTQDGTIVD